MAVLWLIPVFVVEFGLIAIGCPTAGIAAGIVGGLCVGWFCMEQYGPM
jgi:hypothetical protein